MKMSIVKKSNYKGELSFFEIKSDLESLGQVVLSLERAEQLWINNWRVLPEDNIDIFLNRILGKIWIEEYVRSKKIKEFWVKGSELRRFEYLIKHSKSRFRLFWEGKVWLCRDKLDFTRFME